MKTNWFYSSEVSINLYAQTEIENVKSEQVLKIEIYKAHS